jgi:hypothetical protein
MPNPEPDGRRLSMRITNRITATHLPGPVLMRCQRRSGRLRLRAGGAVALLAAGLLAGCGSGAPASSPTKVMSAALHYANCMRSHGVTDFPDPNSKAEFQIQPVQVHNGVRTVSEDLLASSPAFQAAQRACGSLGSAGRQVTAVQEKQEFHLTLQAAECMRANGVPNYPDPKWLNGSIDANYNPSLNINPSSPAFLKAAKKCAHGLPLIGTVGG